VRLGLRKRSSRMRGLFVIALVVEVLMCAGQASSAAQPWTGRYVVRAGDSLTLIAKRYAVSFQTLAEVNGLNWRRPLLIGVVLRVPATTTGERFADESDVLARARDADACADACPGDAGVERELRLLRRACVAGAAAATTVSLYAPSC
jgi:LysM repeat protein